VRSIEEKTHSNATERAGNGNSHDPCEDKETDSLKVDRFEGSVAKTNTNCGTSDAHGCRDWESELGEEKDGDGGTHFHGATSGWRMVGDLVTHDYR
jgi:hypothetical protein